MQHQSPLTACFVIIIIFFNLANCYINLKKSLEGHLRRADFNKMECHFFPAYSIHLTRCSSCLPPVSTQLRILVAPRPTHYTCQTLRMFHLYGTYIYSKLAMPAAPTLPSPASPTPSPFITPQVHTGPAHQPPCTHRKSRQRLVRV